MKKIIKIALMSCPLVLAFGAHAQNFRCPDLLNGNGSCDVTFFADQAENKSFETATQKDPYSITCKLNLTQKDKKENWYVDGYIGSAAGKFDDNHTKIWDGKSKAIVNPTYNVWYENRKAESQIHICPEGHTGASCLNNKPTNSDALECYPTYS